MVQMVKVDMPFCLGFRMCDSVHWLGHSVPLGADVIWYSCYHKYCACHRLL